MKAEKEMNWAPSKDWNVYVILGRGRRTYLYTGVSKSRADQVVKAFNSSLSAHVSQETAPLLAEIDRLKKDVERFEKENDSLRVAYKALERKLNVASESLKEANEFLNDPKKLGEYIAGM